MFGIHFPQCVSFQTLLTDLHSCQLCIFWVVFSRPVKMSWIPEALTICSLLQRIKIKQIYPRHLCVATVTSTLCSWKIHCLGKLRLPLWKLILIRSRVQMNVTQADRMFRPYFKVLSNKKRNSEALQNRPQLSFQAGLHVF